MNIPKIPLGEWVDTFVQWVTVAFAGFFTFLTNSIDGLLNTLVDVLSVGPPIVINPYSCTNRCLYEQMAVRGIYLSQSAFS